MTKKKKANSMVSGIKVAVLNTPAGEFLENLVDSIVSSKLVEAIPAAPLVTGLYKTFSHFKESRFKKRVEEFYRVASEISDDELLKFSRSLGDDGEREAFVSELIDTIDRVDSEQKAAILGGVFIRLVKSEISKDQFYDQVRITSSMFLVDIFTFMHGYHNASTLEDKIGDILVIHHVASRKFQLAERDVNFLAGTKEPYVKTTYTISGIGFAYLATLHQVYRNIIEPMHIYDPKK